MLFENLSIVNKNMRDTNSNPEEIYQTIKRKSVTKGNEKWRTEINCEKRYETLYLLDSGHGNITERTDGTSIADEEFCFDKKKRMRKGKQCTPRKKYPKPTTEPKFDKNIFVIHEHPHSNSNAIDHIEYMFQQRGKTSFKKIGA